MTDQTITHHIQKHILSVLMHVDTARFRDMRPSGVDTNLYSYHLKLLQKAGMIDKVDDGYRLSVEGMTYADRVNVQSVKPSPQPKVITMLIIQNGYGGTLLYRRARQPFIGSWTVPLGKVHDDDSSIQMAAERELREKAAGIDTKLVHVGDAYIRLVTNGSTSMSTLVHVFYGKTDTETIPAGTGLEWVAPHAIPALTTAPAVDQIIARTFFRDPYFFEEFVVNW